MLVSKMRRDDQLGHLAPDDVLGPVAERLLGGRIELEHAAPVVDRDDAVERRFQDRGMTSLPLAHRLLGPAALDELPDLAAEALRGRKQLVVGLMQLAVQELDRTDDATGGPDRETEPGVEPGLEGSLRPREVRVGLHLADPRRRVGRPDTARQPVAGRERQPAADARELLQPLRIGAPRLDTTNERFGSGLLLPHRPELPAERGGNRFEHLGIGLRDGHRLNEDQRDLVLEC